LFKSSARLNSAFVDSSLLPLLKLSIAISMQPGIRSEIYL